MKFVFAFEILKKDWEKNIPLFFFIMILNLAVNYILRTPCLHEKTAHWHGTNFLSKYLTCTT